MALPDMTYPLVLADRTATHHLWLVALVNVNGDAVVVSRWTSRQLADADAARWSELEGSAAT